MWGRGAECGIAILRSTVRVACALLRLSWCWSAPCISSQVGCRIVRKTPDWHCDRFVGDAELDVARLLSSLFRVVPAPERLNRPQCGPAIALRLFKAYRSHSRRRKLGRIQLRTDDVPSHRRHQVEMIVAGVYLLNRLIRRIDRQVGSAGLRNAEDRGDGVDRPAMRPTRSGPVPLPTPPAWRDLCVPHRAGDTVQPLQVGSV